MAVKMDDRKGTYAGRYLRETINYNKTNYRDHRNELASPGNHALS